MKRPPPLLSIPEKARGDRRLVFLVGLVVTGLIAGLYFAQPGLLRFLDFKIYDVFLRSSPGRISPTPVIIDVDDQSLAEYGQWPWPRYRIAHLLEKLKAAGVQSVGIDIIFPEPDRTSLNQIQQEILRDLNVRLALDRVPESLLDHDAALAAVLAGGPFILGHRFIFPPEKAASSGGLPRPLNVAVLRSPGAPNPDGFLYRAVGVQGNIPTLNEAAFGTGFFNTIVDPDGITRRTPLIIHYEGRYYPSLALAAILSARNIRQAILKVASSGALSLRIGETEIPLDRQGNLLIRFCGRARTMHVLSASDVLSGRVGPGQLQGKIAFLGSSATGLKEFQPTPVDDSFPGIEIHATVAGNIIERDFISTPGWVFPFGLLALIAAGIFSAVILSRTGVLGSLPVYGIGMAGLWLGSHWFFNGRSIYLSPLFPGLALTGSFIVLNLLKYWKEELKVRSRTTAVRHLAAIVESSEEPIIGSTLDGRVESWNQGAEKLYGYAAGEIIGRPLALLLDPALEGKTEKLVDRVGHGESVPREETVHRTKDGRPVNISLTISPVRTAKDTLTGFSLVAHDITERLRAEANSRIYAEQMKKAMTGTVHTAAMIAERRDPYTAGHQRRVSDLAAAIALRMGLPEDQVEGIRLAASIHDVGKITVPVEILSKPGKLTELEFRLIAEHAQEGYEILKDIVFPWPIAQIVLQHHERENGSGYPQGLVSSQILLEARIIAVADVVEAMATHRPYRPARGIHLALEEISLHKGVVYDPRVVEACVDLFEKESYRLKEV